MRNRNRVNDFADRLRIAMDSEVLRSRGFVAEVSDIEELKGFTYHQLMDLRQQGEVVIGISDQGKQSIYFNLVSSKTKKYRTILLITCGFLLMTALMSVAVTASPWFLLSIFLFPVCMIYVHKVHMQSIFHGAFKSEIIFCYMFCGGDITVQLPDGSILQRIQP